MDFGPPRHSVARQAMPSSFVLTIVPHHEELQQRRFYTHPPQLHYACSCHIDSLATSNPSVKNSPCRSKNPKNSLTVTPASISSFTSRASPAWCHSSSGPIRRACWTVS